MNRRLHTGHRVASIPIGTASLCLNQTLSAGRWLEPEEEGLMMGSWLARLSAPRSAPGHHRHEDAGTATTRPSITTVSAS
jgi:hypothetical protein